MGIGASAGGVEALRQFFGHLPPEATAADGGMAFVVILHLAPDVESNLSDILQHETALRVVRAEDGAAVTGGTVYVISPGQHLTIQDGHLRVEDGGGGHDGASVDRFFRSLAADQGTNAVGVVLSGSGGDGSLGLRAIKEAGGVTMVHAPDDAQYQGMPASALATGLVDLSLPAGELAEKLAAYRDHAGVIQLPDSDEALEDDERGTLATIFRHLYQTTGLDFSNYKRSTVLRRLERRLQLNGAETLDDYSELLRESTGEVHSLQKDLLISVTSFFRDPEAFAALEETVVPALFEDKGAADQVRVWVPGCATGEEAYSIAMLLVEHVEQMGASAPGIQVFATDVDEEALAFGRNGLYPKAIMEDVAPDRLTRFFQADGEFYQINHGLRDCVLFADHNLLEDPPFSNLDLISCRNLLIYLNQKLQRHAYRLIHYGLREKGYLFLGRSEALGQADHMFETVDSSNNILQARDRPAGESPRAPISSILRRKNRTQGGGSAQAEESETDAPIRRVPGPFSPSSRPSPGFDLEPDTESTAKALHQRVMMEEVASVLVNADKKILHLSGAADRYLRFEEGAPTNDFLSCVPETLRGRLRSALHQALEEGTPVYRTGMTLEIEGAPRRLSVAVRPIEENGARYAHVRFEDLAVTDSGPSEDGDPDREGAEVAQVRAELRETREQLQTTTEEYEAATEEMETANEELLSMNEELQSKNEELETSKEELQSVNEELKATNEELKAKVEELRQSKGAIENLVAATEIATLFLDRDFCIQRFTPEAATLFDLREADLGRPLTDVTRGFDQEDLLEEAQRAFREGESVEREVRRGSDEWFLAKLRPYHTVDGAVTGVVLTLVDITRRRQLEREIVNTTEKVRRQIGQDLHDILSSDLAALAMKLDNYKNRLEREETADPEALDEFIQQARAAAEQSRTLSHALVPVALQEEHLAAALDNLCREQEELSGMALQFDGDREERLPRNKETAMHFYRIAHEAVINARRHADADRIWVQLGRTDGQLEMIVQDDGVGMPEDIDEVQGMGVRTMRYRANLIGASLSFEAGEEASGGTRRGTTLRCLLPLDEAEGE